MSKFIPEKIDSVKVYICGPITGKGTAELQKAVRLHEQLRKAGYVPFLPHLYHLLFLMTDITYNDVIYLDAQWLTECDVVYKLPGSSPGVIGEERLACRLNKNIVTNMRELIELFPVTIISSTFNEGRLPYDNYTFLCKHLGIKV